MSLAAPVTQKILVVGDSLSAEYGLTRGQGWVALLELRLKEQQKNVQVINASISGDTSAGGKARLPALLGSHKPNLVLIELGANDALRGFPLVHTKANLRAMVQDAQRSGAKVLLLGMQVPPNYGRQYTTDFTKLYIDLATSEKLPLVPFILKDVADRPDASAWFQADHIHPKAQAHPIILDNVWAHLKLML